MAAIIRSTVYGVLVEVLKKHGIRNLRPSIGAASILMDAFRSDRSPGTTGFLRAALEARR